ncbi:hypothetical protein JSE7799_02732 [Jannaschia seosinensis]|uniref:Uncharacterized protein n=1 Tax=Jannaschia seosinensis TaxID=313367 RepID=A0A0M7BDN6_9RHOB|nr:hypothetical protein JSE7799_02732 [Jannaschia seosinensis]
MADHGAVAGRRAVARVVVMFDQRLGQRDQRTRPRQVVPRGDGVARMIGAQRVDPAVKKFPILRQVGIGAQQVARPRPGRRVEADHRGRAHRLPQAGRDQDVADGVALGLEKQRPVGVKLGERGGEAGFEHLLGRLSARAPAEIGAAVVRQPFEVDHLRAGRLHMGKELCLAGAGAAVDQDRRHGQVRIVEHGLHQPPIRLVAALQHADPPADLFEDRREGARSLAAPPAIDEGSPAAVAIRQRAFEMGGGIARDQRGADLAGEETVLPHVDRADAGAFRIRQDGQVDRTGQMILGEFGGGAHVDDLVEGQGVEGGEIGDGMAHGAARCRSRGRGQGVRRPFTPGAWWR